MDDGSTEKERSNLIRIVDELDDQRVCLASILKENKGGGAARNFNRNGFRKIHRISRRSDDEWMKDKLLIQTAEAINGNLRWLWSCQSLVFHGSGDGVLPQNLSIASTVADYLFVRNGITHPTSSFFIHRETSKTFALTSLCPVIKIMTFCFNWNKLGFDQELSLKFLSRCIGKNSRLPDARTTSRLPFNS